MKLIPFILVVLFAFLGCQERKEHIAPAVNPRDSVSTMVTYGVNMLVSDSGMMKYRIVSECWEANQAKKPSRWIFEKGLFLEQFDPKFHVEAYIQCDTAYYFDQEKLWELRGRVRVKTLRGCAFQVKSCFGIKTNTNFTVINIRNLLPRKGRWKALISGVTNA